MSENLEGAVDRLGGEIRYRVKEMGQLGLVYGVGVERIFEDEEEGE